LFSALEIMEPTSDSHGLRADALSPVETLAQSIASIAPTAGPALTMPAVFALAGNATWLVYFLGTLSMVLVALSVRQFARRSASPGSLYEYAASALSPFWAAVTGWSLLMAYAGTAGAVTGGFSSYLNVLVHLAFGINLPAIVPTAISVGFATWIAVRDIRLSARLMLSLESISVLLIVMIASATLLKSSTIFDAPQLELSGVSLPHLGPGLVLALFSFVGFESATALGAEARNPLRSIPRAVLGSAILVGIFFVICAYIEVVGFRSAGLELGNNETPLQVLAEQARMNWAGPLIAAGAMFSFFACTLACLTAGARVLFFMARRGLLHGSMGKAHLKNETPSNAVLVVALFTMLMCGPLAALGAAGTEVNGWLGTLATYGFIVAYLLVVIAAPIHWHRNDELSLRHLVLAAVAGVSMLGALGFSLYPVPPAPYLYLPYCFAAYLLTALLVSRAMAPRTVPA
jgi:amino acid transporter